MLMGRDPEILCTPKGFVVHCKASKELEVKGAGSVALSELGLASASAAWSSRFGSPQHVLALFWDFYFLLHIPRPY